MIAPIVLALLSLSAPALALSNAKDVSAIVPYFAMIKSGDMIYCNGALVGPARKTVLTSAQCLNNNQYKAEKVAIGKTDITNATLLTQLKTVAKKAWSAKWGGSEVSDIGAVCLSDGFLAVPGVAGSATLDYDAIATGADTSLFGLGLGAADKFNKVKKVDLKVQDPLMCTVKGTMFFQGFSGDVNMCAGDSETSNYSFDACKGDGGSPLVLKDTSKLVGIQANVGLCNKRPLHMGFTKLSGVKPVVEALVDFCENGKTSAEITSGAGTSALSFLLLAAMAAVRL